jgi:hypothetical protein
LQQQSKGSAAAELKEIFMLQGNANNTLIAIVKTASNNNMPLPNKSVCTVALPACSTTSKKALLGHSRQDRANIGPRRIQAPGAPA